jgi:HD superfamily phosphohydrolase
MEMWELHFKELYYKVSRDPIYGEIKLYPFEILLIDSKPLQRLRRLSQLAGAEAPYPSATHTRFSHSLGVMYVSGLYGEHLYEDEYKIMLLRLAGLLHDVGHGPFSHQFDDVVYKRCGYAEGHDEFRKKIVVDYLPNELEKKFKDLDDNFRDQIIENCEIILKRKFTDPLNDFKEILKKTEQIFAGEGHGDVNFNVVQGPLGADRLDFVIRDAYFSGTKHYGTVPIDRIIRNCFIKNYKGKQILCYSNRVIDDIFSVMVGRFMMYKNVYFHKTARAADLLIQEILKLSIDVLNLKDRIEDMNEFLKLTDQRIIDEIEILYQNNPKDKKLSELHKLVQRLLSRDLWKKIFEVPFTAQGTDPSVLAESFSLSIIENIKKSLEELLKSKDYDPEDEKNLKYILKNSDKLFKIDTPYKLTLMSPDEFIPNEVYLYDKLTDSVQSFDEFLKNSPFTFMSAKTVQIIRIYITEDKRNLIFKYKLLPNLKTQTTTRW